VRQELSPIPLSIGEKGVFGIESVFYRCEDAHDGKLTHPRRHMPEMVSDSR
jgi:hypothetical protein